MTVELTSSVGFYPNIMLVIELVDKEVEMFTHILTKILTNKPLNDKEKQFIIQIENSYGS